MSPARMLPRLALAPRIATILLALAVTLLPVALVAAATSPLGFTLGQTTLAEVDPAAFDFDGLEQVLLIFNTAEQHLAMVVLTIAKRRFRDVLADLRAKYSVDRERIDNFMQNGEALFRSGDDWIYLKAPHLSFSIELTYATDEVWREMVRGIEENKAKKRQQERGKL